MDMIKENSTLMKELFIRMSGDHKWPDSPRCPKCGNGNAVLNHTVLAECTIGKCRDCGYIVKAEEFKKISNEALEYAARLFYPDLFFDHPHCVLAWVGENRWDCVHKLAAWRFRIEKRGDKWVTLDLDPDRDHLDMAVWSVNPTLKDAADEIHTIWQSEMAEARFYAAPAGAQ